MKGKGSYRQVEDDIKEWTGMDFASTNRAAEKGTVAIICGAPITLQGYAVANVSTSTSKYKKN